MQELMIHKAEDETKTIMLLENGIVVEKYEETPQSKRLEGNVYLGKIQNVLPGMQAAFVDIGASKNTFIHLKDILPKIDVTKTEGKTEVETKNIKQYIRPGMPLLVQVKRDSTNKKGARVSTHISLTSRFFVLMPETQIVTISQKIEKEEEKERLLKLTKENLPKDMGAIIRTSAEGQSIEMLQEDIQVVCKRWKAIQQKVEQGKMKTPILIEENNNLLQRIIMDTIDRHISKITTNDSNLYVEVEELLKKVTTKKIELDKQPDLMEHYDLLSQIDKTKHRKIWLKCGGFITIDKTEALTAIDVNSGKYIGSQSLEQTVLKVNKEASTEIAKQIRLRDIGGIIIIDYIDMLEGKHQKEVIRVLEESLKQDRSKTQVLGFTKLNLLEMTRKHMCSND